MKRTFVFPWKMVAAERDRPSDHSEGVRPYSGRAKPEERTGGGTGDGRKPDSKDGAAQRKEWM